MTLSRSVQIQQRRNVGFRGRAFGSAVRAFRLATLSFGLCHAGTSCGANSLTMPSDDGAENVASVRVSPDSLNASPILFAGRRPRFAVTLLDSAQQPLQGISLRWSSSDTDVATVTADGFVVARQVGEAVITAAAGRHWATSHVTVQADGDTDIIVIAHRGFAGIFPENTLVAMHGAYDKGADAIEIDIRLSGDGVPVVIHDATVDRTTNGTGAVSSLTAQQLQQLDACSKFGPQWKPCPVPTLWDALQVARGRSGRLLLHIQDGFPSKALPNVIQMVRSAQLVEQVIYTCFDDALLRAIGTIDPAASLGYLVKRIPSPDGIAQMRSAAVLVHVDSLLSQPGRGQEFVQRAKAAGVDVGAWTIWSNDQAKAVLAAGNVRLISDYPLDKTLLR